MSGPGTFSQALAIRTEMTGTDLGSDQIWIEDHDIEIDEITVGPRIGVDYAGEDAKRPYRFIARSL